MALFLAGPAKREILASGGRETGLGLVTAARVLAIVHLVFVALLVVLVVFVLAVPFAFVGRQMQPVRRGEGQRTGVTHNAFDPARTGR